MRTNIFLIIFLFMISLTACNDFLETTPSADVADSEVFKTTEGAQAALNGAYYQLRAYGSGGADRSDDYGIPSLIMTYDVCGEDMMVWGGWYSYDYSFWGHTRGDIFKTHLLWTFHYRLINNVNNIIANIDQALGSDAEKDAIKGQALALRGWAYFGLIRLFQQTYSIAKDMPGVPIYTEPTTGNTEGKPRGTVQQTYDQILSDLETAKELLSGYDRGNRMNTMDQSVVEGILARVYMTMNDWSKMELNAKEARQNYTLMSKEEFQSGFNDFNEEWMWGMYQTKDQSMGDYSPFAMWANWSRKCYSFECFFLNDRFVNLFDENDIRYQFFYQWDMIWCSNKFRDNEDCIGSFVFMRSSEMLLMEAEALARQGKDNDAKQLLWELQDMRNAERTESSGEQLINDILVERRKELYGEGFAWFDIIRNQTGLHRGGDHREVVDFPARSWRFVYQIPNSEITNNKNLKEGIWPEGDQTPFDGIYTPQ